jgi:hypothetical protein
MEDPRAAKVIEIKRRPSMWSVKAAARYIVSFSGHGRNEGS